MVASQNEFGYITFSAVFWKFQKLMQLLYLHFSCLWLSATPWPVADHVSLSIGFFRQEYWSGLPFSPAGGSSWCKDWIFASCGSCIAGGFLTIEPLGNPMKPSDFCLLEAFIFFPIIFISWRLITLQYCCGFSHTLTWISHGFTCVPHPETPSQLPPHPISLGHPSALALSTCLVHQTLTGYLFHTW